MLEAEHGDRSGASEVISHGLESRKASVSWITEQITSISFGRRGRLVQATDIAIVDTFL